MYIISEYEYMYINTLCSICIYVIYMVIYINKYVYLYKMYVNFCSVYSEGGIIVSFSWVSLAYSYN